MGPVGLGVGVDVGLGKGMASGVGIVVDMGVDLDIGVGVCVVVVGVVVSSMFIGFACDDGNSPIKSSSSAGVCVFCCASGVGGVGVDGNFDVVHCCRFSSGSLASLTAFCWVTNSINASSLLFEFCAFACMLVCMLSTVIDSLLMDV